MARVDDYRQAIKLAVDRLRKDSIADLAARSGFERVDENSLRIPFLDRSYRIVYPDLDLIDEAGDPEEIPLQEQVIILHYLVGAGSAVQTGNLIPYREIQGASFYHGVFIKRAIDPLKKTFGQNPSLLSAPAGRMRGQAIGHGDVSFAFQMLPKVSIQIILWEGDAEFPAEANILFDSVVSDIFTPEDAAWAASLLVYRLIALSRQPG